MKYDKEKVSNLINGGQTGLEMMADYIDYLEKELKRYTKCVETGNALVDCGEIADAEFKEPTTNG